MDPIPKRYLNIPETAQYLRLSPGTIYNRTSPKSKDPFPIPFKRIGRKILFDIQDITKFMEGS
jgi:predicted DNA-binding transcriptional regulator AlpA